eukprot:GAHX01001846.1.p1 GENE.GAHX01001846.1~~GAHX01001846.1.p1  ORF type:complete len:671 (+),score=155.13 GAHX01001846.1:43-2013(+)
MLRLLGVKGVSLPLDYINQNLRQLSKKYLPYTHYNARTTFETSSTLQYPVPFEALRSTNIKISEIEKSGMDNYVCSEEKTIPSLKEKVQPSLHDFLKDKLNQKALKKMARMKQQNKLASAVHNLKLTKKGTKILKIIEAVVTSYKQPSCFHFVADIKSRTSFDTSKFLINMLTFSDYLYFRNHDDSFEDRIGKALNFYFSTKAYRNLHLDDAKSIDSCNTGELLLESIYLTTDIQYKMTSVENMCSPNATVFELLFNAFELNDKELVKTIAEDKTSSEDVWVRMGVELLLNNKIEGETIDIPDTFEDDVYRKTCCYLIKGNLDNKGAKDICGNLPFIEDTIWFFSYYNKRFQQNSLERMFDLIIENYSDRGVLQIFHRVLISLFLGKYNEVMSMLIKGQFYWESVVILLNFCMFYEDFDKTNKQGFFNKLLEKFGKMNKLTLVKTMREKFIDKLPVDCGRLQVNNVLAIKEDMAKETYFVKYMETNILQFNIINIKNSESINDIKKWVKDAIMKKNIKLNYLCFLITVYKLHKMCHEENTNEGFKLIKKLDIFPTHKDKEEEVARKLKVFKNKEQNFNNIIGSCGICLIELYWLKYKELKEDNGSKLVKRDSEKERTAIREIKEDLNNIIYFYARSDDRGYDCILKYLMKLESLII